MDSLLPLDDLERNIIRAHSESSDKTIAKSLRQIDGQKLVQVKVQSRRGTSEFHFELGAVLKTLPYEELDSENEPYESWLLFEPNGKVLSYRADGKYSYHSAQARVDQARWI